MLVKGANMSTSLYVVASDDVLEILAGVPAGTSAQETLFNEMLQYTGIKRDTLIWQIAMAHKKSWEEDPVIPKGRKGSAREHWKWVCDEIKEWDEREQPGQHLEYLIRNYILTDYSRFFHLKHEGWSMQSSVFEYLHELKILRGEAGTVGEVGQPECSRVLRLQFADLKRHYD